MTQIKPTILICDDEEGVRESYKLILGEQYNLIMATNGPSCLEILKNKPEISLVIMDIKMPGQNGLEVTREIASRYPKTKIIIATGYSSSEIAREAIAAGAIDYIVKPFEIQDVRNTIMKHL